MVHEVELVLEEVSKSSKSKLSVSLLKEGTKSRKSEDGVKKEWRKGRRSKHRHSISVH